MNTIHYVRALFIAARSANAVTEEAYLRYIVEELTIFSEDDVREILTHLIPMMQERPAVALPALPVEPVDCDPC
jgi:hypothetical protein